MLISRTIEKARTKLKSLVIYSKSSLEISYFLSLFLHTSVKGLTLVYLSRNYQKKICINCAKAARLKPRVPKNTLQNAANWQINGAHRSNFTVKKKQR